MKNLYLAAPDIKYKKSFEDYVLAYQKSDNEFYFSIYKKALENFPDYLNELHSYSIGIDLPQGEVKTSTYWLINETEVLGVVRIRHQDVGCDGNIGYDISPNNRNQGYGFEILNLALEKAEQIGLNEVYLTCNIENSASRKIIEKNGGKLLGTVFDTEENEHLYKYCITLVSE